MKIDRFNESVERLQRRWQPEKYSIVWHNGCNFEDNKNYPCHVYIIGGQFFSNDRVSNFWNWKRILPNGDLAEEECGYGDFFSPKVIMNDVYTPEEIKEEYPEKYQEYLMKKDAKKYNL